MSRAPAVEVRGLTRRFRDTTAVEDLDLRVDGPGVFGFLGANGAGKTTVIRMLVGLIHPTRGEIRLLGRKVSAMDADVRSRLGYLPQYPEFYGWMTGEETLLHVGDLFGLSRGASKARAAELLDLAGLSEAAGRRVGGYSGGMKQRLGIAQALVNDPELILLDEPVSALDPVGRMEVLELIHRLGKTATVFMSSHILADVERVCEEVAIIEKGRLLVHERTESLKARAMQPIMVIGVRGDARRLRELLAREDWVLDASFLPPSASLGRGEDSSPPSATAVDVAAEEKSSLGDLSRSAPDHARGTTPRAVAEGVTQLRVTVADPSRAELRLPALLVEGAVGLVSLSPMTPSLEEVFINLVGQKSPSAGEEIA